MGEKKSKALAQELMDDLLNDDATEALNPPAADENKTEVLGTVVQPVARSARSLSSQSPPDDEDHTVQIGEDEAMEIPDPPSFPSEPKLEKKRVRASVGRFATMRSSGAPSSTEAALAQSESLRIAQNRILELEQEIERLRLQNEELGAAGETLRRRADELLSEAHRRDNDFKNAQATFDQERSILLNSKEAMMRDMEAAKRKNEELELRISTNIQKIRVRERELENRLELVKMESAAIIRSKDEMILELKRNIDQLNLELNNYRGKNQELNRSITDKQEMLRRTVKALRLALSMLEGEEESANANPSPLKKAK